MVTPPSATMRGNGVVCCSVPSGPFVKLRSAIRSATLRPPNASERFGAPENWLSPSHSSTAPEPFAPVCRASPRSPLPAIGPGGMPCDGRSLIASFQRATRSGVAVSTGKSSTASTRPSWSLVGGREPASGAAAEAAAAPACRCVVRYSSLSSVGSGDGGGSGCMIDMLASYA